MNNITRLERATVKFCEGLSIDGYRTPSGEFRVGVTGASLLLGFSKQWLSQVHTRGGKTLKTLQSLGFTGSQLFGTVAERENSARGASEVKTISLDDFNRLILYAASRGKQPAIALQLSLTKMSLNDFFRDAFGERPLTIAEKRQLFYTEFAKTINWLQEDRLDIQLIEQQLDFVLG